MATKQNPGPYDFYANALPDEPMFVLLARDPRAPALVEGWAEQRKTDIERGSRPKSDMAMVHEARACGADMRLWRAANDGRWRTETAPARPDVNADLLAALKLCLPLMKAEWGNYGPQEPEGHAIKVAHAAIAKAEPS
jgi:hypothetical protein